MVMSYDKLDIFEFQGSWHVLKFDKETSKSDNIKENSPGSDCIPMHSTDKVRFKKLASGIKYKICISTQINGTIVATTSTSVMRYLKFNPA